MKKCNRCLIEKEMDEFFRDSNHSTGRYSICKLCKQNSTYKWREDNREKYNAGMRAYGKKHRRRMHYKQKYGISIEQYNAILEQQGNACWICRKQNTSVKRPFALDHNHATGKIRGILCYGCNRAISLLDNPKLYGKAHEYLSKNA